MQDLESQSITSAATPPPKRVALLVLGMHRSGTSALTRVLNLLGAELSGDLLPANSGNPRGYWESAEGTALHDRILAELGSSWDSPLPFNFDRLASASAQQVHGELLELLRRDFGTADLFAVKDPRICRLVPLWLDLLREFGAEARFILSIRHPCEVADSLARRDGMARDKAMLLWLRYVLEAERATRDQPRTILLYSDLVRDWRPAMARVGQELAIDWPRSLASAAMDIDRFITPELHRSRVSEDGELQPFPWVGRVWHEIATATAESGKPGLNLEPAHRLMAEVDSLFAPLIRASQARQAALHADLVRLQEEAAGRAGELAMSQSDLAASQSEIDRLQGDVVRLIGEQTSSQAEMQRLLAEVARLAGDLAISEADRLELRQEIAAFVDDARRRKAEMHELEGRLNAILRSKSWRMTAPLRAIARRLFRR